MKTATVLFLLWIFGSVSGLIFAQDCSFYYPKSEGAELTYQQFDNKGKLTGSLVHQVMNYSENGDRAEADINLKMYDKKDKLISETMLEVKCESGTFYFDMRSYVSQETLDAFKDMDIVVETDELEMPSGLKAGDKLKDGSIKINVQSSGISIMNMNITITDREVLAIENVEVGAGNYECYKINQVVQTSTPFKISTRSVEWMSEGIGMIKSESYDRRGNLDSTTELMKLDI